MAEYVADGKSLYADSTVAAEMVLSDPALPWHLLQGAHISKEERRVILAQVGGAYSRCSEVKASPLKLTPYDKMYVTMWTEGAPHGNFRNESSRHADSSWSAWHSHPA